MLIGVYGDVHLTKNMRTLQSVWDKCAKESFWNMYDHFDRLEVDKVVCLGDFFDTPRLEAKHMNLVLPILEDINNRSYPTYILLGNHEADDEKSNILDYLSMYENIVPVTLPLSEDGMRFLPYYCDPKEFKYYPDQIVFTHHDIYGSSLASGKTKAFFGIDPGVFKDAKLVLNGHVHLRSRVSDNIVNTGSLLSSCQGELVVGDYPAYYLLNTESKGLGIQSYPNIYSMIYLAIDIEKTHNVMDYDSERLVLRVDYEGEIPEEYIETLHTSWRKKLSSIGNKSEERIINTSNFDIKNYLVEYIKKDETIPEDQKEMYIKTGLELLS